MSEATEAQSLFTWRRNFRQRVAPPRQRGQKRNRRQPLHSIWLPKKENAEAQTPDQQTGNREDQGEHQSAEPESLLLVGDIFCRHRVAWMLRIERERECRNRRGPARDGNLQWKIERFPERTERGGRRRFAQHERAVRRMRRQPVERGPAQAYFLDRESAGIARERKRNSRRERVPVVEVEIVAELEAVAAERTLLLTPVAGEVNNGAGRDLGVGLPVQLVPGQIGRIEFERRPAFDDAPVDLAGEAGVMHGVEQWLGPGVPGNSEENSTEQEQEPGEISRSGAR